MPSLALIAFGVPFFLLFGEATLKAVVAESTNSVTALLLFTTVWFSIFYSVDQLK